jgi:hypothetical protein
MRHSFTLQALPLVLPMEEYLNDLSWLLHDDYAVDCYTSLMILPPVMLVFQDSLVALAVSLEPDITEPIH